MNNLGSTNKRKDFYQGSKSKNSKVNNSTVQDIFPFQVNNQQYLTPQTKQYINELERIYIQRYNILIRNRAIYEDIIDNISTELDQQGAPIKKLTDLFQSVTHQKINNLQKQG